MNVTLFMVCLSVRHCLFICLLSVCLSVTLLVCLSVTLLVYLFIVCLSVTLLVYLFIVCLFVCLSICHSPCLSVYCLSVTLLVCLSVYCLSVTLILHLFIVCQFIVSLIIQTLHIASWENGRERRVWYFTPLIAVPIKLPNFCSGIWLAIRTIKLHMQRSWRLRELVYCLMLLLFVSFCFLVFPLF